MDGLHVVSQFRLFTVKDAVLQGDISLPTLAGDGDVFCSPSASPYSGSEAADVGWEVGERGDIVFTMAYLIRPATFFSCLNVQRKI